MNQIPVRFTLHAIDKLDLVVEQGFSIQSERVSEFVRRPPRIYRGSNDNPIVHVPLDDEHILRVVFVSNSEEFVVVTVYPSRRDRYEF